MVSRAGRLCASVLRCGDDEWWFVSCVCVRARLNPDDKRMRSPVSAAQAAPRASSLSNATSNNNGNNGNTLAAKWGRVKGSLTGGDVNQGMPRMTPVAMQLKELLPHQLAQTPT